MTLATGTRLGPYEVLSPLGAGGMGEVYRARDTRLSREVAIKVLPAELAAESERLKRFEKEARSASALNHPNIVTIYDIGSEGGVPYIAMERVEGATLRELLANGALPTRKLFQIAPQIAEGLSKAHEAGIVHRDLKPENVMVTKDGLVKILDFGLAKLTSTMSGSDAGSHLPTMTGTTPGMVVGTVGYMSPEQASGETLDFRSDQFSFGSILYEMATGRRAFQKKTAIDTLAAILNEEPEPIASVNPQVPAPLRWITERCLEKEPEGRYVSTRDLARELATVRDHVSEASLSAVAPAGASSKGVRVRTAVLALAFAAALAAGVFAGRPLWKARFDTHPTLRQVTFRRVGLNWARFGPDGQTILYSLHVDGPGELYTSQVGNPESRSLGLPPANILSVSASGQLAILVGDNPNRGTLATVSLAGGAPRELMESVWDASWAPDGKNLAVVHEVDGRTRIEYPLGTMLYQPSGQTHFIQFSPAGDRMLFVTARNAMTVDLSGRTSRITASPFEARWSPRGDEVWLNEIGGGMTSIYAVTLSGKRRFLAAFPGDFVLHDVSRDGRVLLERETMEYEMVGRAPGQAAERNLTWLDGSVPADISADGTLLLFTEVAMGGAPAGGVYKRGTDGSPAVRLGEGIARALSPDGKWALAYRGGEGSRLILLPTGPGQQRELPLSGITPIGDEAIFFPDDKSILLRAMDAEQRIRLYVLDIETGKARAVTPEGVHPQVPFLLSPDGKSVICNRGPENYERYELAAGTARKISVGGVPIKWCADGRFIFVLNEDSGLLKVSRQDLASGRQESWRDVPITDLGTRVSAAMMFPTPDGKSYVYGYTRYFADLFVAEGLR